MFTDNEGLNWQWECGCGRGTNKYKSGFPCCSECEKVENWNERQVYTFADRGKPVEDDSTQLRHSPVIEPYRIQMEHVGKNALVRIS